MLQLSQLPKDLTKHEVDLLLGNEVTTDPDSAKTLNYWFQSEYSRQLEVTGHSLTRVRLKIKEKP